MNRPMVRDGATVLRPLAFGPRTRPPGSDRERQVCVCGIEFTTYWAHRQTTQHTRMVAATRAARRAEAAAVVAELPVRLAAEHMSEPAGEAA
jgi:hypothetical protein